MGIFGAIAAGVVAIKYTANVDEAVAAVKAGGGKTIEGKKLLDKITKLTDEFKKRTDKLEAALNHSSSNTEKHAKHFRDSVVPAMVSLRETSDALEAIIPHEQWPLPTYREMLFIK